MPRPNFGALSTLLILFTITIFCAGPASATPFSTTSSSVSVPPPSVTIEGAVSVFGDAATTTYTLTVVDGRVSSLLVVTHQDPRLPADVGSVADAMIDGGPAAPGSVALTGPDLTFDLGPRAPGVYTVTFAVAVASPTATTYSSGATARYTAVGPEAGMARSAPVLVVIGADDTPAVDLSVTLSGAGSAVEPIPIGAGALGDSLAYITNNGTARSSLSLLVEVGAGLRIGNVLDIGEGPDGVRPMSCPIVDGDPQRRTCQFPALASGGEIVVDVEVGIAPSQVAAPTAALTLTVTPTSPGRVEADPSDNSGASIFEFAGIANLRTAIAVTTPTTTVGSSLAVTITVTNTGPNAAPKVSADLELSGEFGAFEMVGLYTPAPPGALNVGRSSSKWPIGDLAVGQSASATLTLRALKAGTVILEVSAHSRATDPGCATTADCPVTDLPLTASAPVLTPPPTTAGTTGIPPVTDSPESTAGSTGALAETGSPTRVLGLAAIVSLAVGAGLVGVARRRPDSEPSRS